MALLAIHVLIFDGFADWEPAHALAELRRSGKRDVVAVGFSNNPVLSMGGLRVLPDRSLAEVTPEEIGLFILPGGDVWGTGDYPEPVLSTLLRQLNASGVPIAAICGATLALAREVLVMLGVFSSADQAMWFDMYKSGQLPGTVRT
jgi:putative intracellular protease/amidase